MTKRSATAAPPELATIASAAAILDCHTDTIRRMIARGDLQAVRVGSGLRAPIRIPMESIRSALHPVATVATVRAYERGDADTAGGVR